MFYSSMISIVTVVYNDFSNIEKTLLSIKSQSYRDINYIVIDGGSTDGTLNVIEKYRDIVSVFISEPDKGIYDAMNKSLNYATGKWIYFLNSGDVFCSDKVLEELQFEYINEKVKVIYGNIVLGFKYGQISKKISPSKDVMPSIYHQATFVRTEQQLKYSFDLNYKYCADYNSIYLIFKNGGHFLYKDIYVAVYDMNGFSASNVLKFYYEKSAIDGCSNILSEFKFRIKNLLRLLAPNIYDYLYYLLLKLVYKK